MESKFRFDIELNKYGIPTTDVGFNILEACEYNYWMHGVLNTTPVMGVKPGATRRINLGRATPTANQKVIPVGTLDFAQKYLGRQILPIGIPTCLSKYANRRFDYLTVTNPKISKGQLAIAFDSFGTNTLFIKRADKLKQYTDIIKRGRIPMLEPGIYLISENIEEKDKAPLDAEWRVFVYKGQARGCHIYSGNQFAAPPARFIDSAIQAMSANPEAPPAYTLDVATSFGGSNQYLIEVHNFVSCGLYGFEDLDILCQMVIQSYLWEEKHLTII